MDSSREDKSRITVGTVQGWQRLKDNYRHAVLTHLKGIVSESNGNKDVLIAHMNRFVDQTFTTAQLNLRVNGQNYETVDQNEQNVEQFDESLDRRIWSLADTRLQWHRRIADTRRGVPVEIENSLATLLQQHRAAAAEEVGIDEEEYQAEQDAAEEQPPPFPEVEEGLQRTLALGELLDQEIQTLNERISRLRGVEKEVNALKS